MQVKIIVEDAMLTIDEYRFGQIVISGTVYTSDIKMLPHKIVSSNWWRKEGHKVYIEDIEDILNEGIEILILGMGDPGMMVAHESLKRYLQKQGITLIQRPSKEAAKEFNQLVQKGKKVGAGFHLTC